MDQPQVRAERAGDEPGIRDVNDQAFGRTAESDLIEAVRQSGHSTISLVATLGDRVLGHIFFSPVAIEGHGPENGVMGLGPMAVRPAFQRQGIGSRLVQAGLDACTRSGCEVVVVLGHPDFYPRFGFRPARRFGLRSEYAVPDEAFMAVELTEGALSGHTGLVRYLPEFRSV